MLTNDKIKVAQVYNSRQGFSVPVGFGRSYFAEVCYDPSSVEYAEGIAAFQADNELRVDGKAGPITQSKIQQFYAPPPVRSGSTDMTDEDRQRLASFTIAHEGGKGNPYAACNKDAEYQGWFDHPKREGKRRLRPSEIATRPDHKPHRASKYHPRGGFHIGLSYGAWQAAQEPGSLGTLLREMQNAHPDAFEQIFPHSKELLKVTNAKGKRQGTRSPRTQPVGGADLWQSVWVDAFRTAGDVESFQEAQRRWVAVRYLDPAIKTAKVHRLNREGDLAVLFDVAIQFGVGGMNKYVKKSRLTKAGEKTDESIFAVIDALPRKHRPRRRSILEHAGQKRQYDL